MNRKDRIKLAWRILTQRVPFIKKLAPMKRNHSDDEEWLLKVTGEDLAFLMARKACDIMPIYMGFRDKFTITFNARINFQDGENPRFATLCDLEESLEEYQ